MRVQVYVLRDPAVGMSAASQAVIPVNYFLIAVFFPPALWVEDIEEFQVMVAVQIKLPVCFTQVNETDLFF